MWFEKMKVLGLFFVVGCIAFAGSGLFPGSANSQTTTKDKMKKEMMKKEMMKKEMMKKEMMMKDKMMKPPFGEKGDVAYSKALWKALKNYRLVGDKLIMTKPYEGSEPHGAVLETIARVIGVKGKFGMAIVKRNYGPKGIDADQVAEGGGKLGAVTVMYKRKGYDPDNGDWFWAKYKADGSLHTNPKGMMLAGRVAKGAEKGCIACHKNAPGDDFVFAPFVR